MGKTIRMGGQSPNSFDSLLQQELEQATQGHQQIADEWALIRERLLDLRSELMPAQLAMLLDPAKRRAVVATRRSGKTYFNRHQAAEKVADNPWTDRRKAQPVVQYIAQTQKKALDLFWTPFKNICERVGMQAHWDDSNLRAQFSNGVLVRASGVDTGFDIEKYRGDAYVHVTADEAASYGPKVERLVVEGLGMAMADYNGTIDLTGTPGPTEVGYFYEVYKKLKPEWSVHPCWSFMDNVHLPPETRTWEWVEQNLGPLDSPKVRREAKGEWVTDSNTLVYSGFRADQNVVDALPAGHDWRFLLGLDLGFRDPCAFVVGAYAKTHPTLFVVYTHAQTHMMPSEIEHHIATLQQRFKFTRIVVDTGGSMAPGNVLEWNRRLGLSMLPADKAPGYKHTAIEHLNNDLWSARIKLLMPAAAALAEEWKTLPWGDAEESEARQRKVRHDGKQQEHPGFPNHLSDAMLYMFMESRHYRSDSVTEPPTPGSIDWWHLEQQKAKLDAYARLRRPGQHNRSVYGKHR